MKRFIHLIILLLICTSCSNDDQATTIDLEEELSGKWVLIQMGGSTPDSETTGTAMEWQEYYTLDLDGTFIKSREREGHLIKVTGTYIIIESEENTFIEFTFDFDNEIIGSCISNLKENLYLSSENKLVSTWEQCDGPSLIYNKIDR